MADIQKIVPFLWYPHSAEEAAEFYISVFGNGKILQMSHYDKNASNAAGMPEGSVMVVEFELFGQRFQAINAGPVFTFTEAISFLVNCENQEEVDNYWNALSARPESEQCGWLKDKFGLSWQIVPKQLGELLSDPNAKKAQAVMHAMLQMKKIDIAKLQEAHDSA